MKKVGNGKKCNMKLVQHEKRATCKKCNMTKLQYERMQREKYATWK